MNTITKYKNNDIFIHGRHVEKVIFKLTKHLYT